MPLPPLLVLLVFFLSPHQTTCHPPPLLRAPNVRVPPSTFQYAQFLTSFIPHIPSPKLGITEVVGIVPPPDSAEIANDQAGLTAVPCTQTSECKGNRNCIQIHKENIDICRSDRPNICFCFPFQLPFCTASVECEQGEECVALKKNGETQEKPICMSSFVAALSEDLVVVEEESDEPAAKDTSSGSRAEEGCVWVAHLEKEGERVYESDLRRWVLCDEAGSCATGGHVVVVGGEVMMMRTYCERVVCKGRWEWVNSPKWGRAVRVKSRTEGLEFTAFAARWGSSVEERVLSFAVRAGL